MLLRVNLSNSRTKVFFYPFFLHFGSINLNPEGRAWNSSGWETSLKVEPNTAVAVWSTEMPGCYPMISPLSHLSIPFRKLPFFKNRFPHHDTSKKGFISTIKENGKSEL